MNTLRGEAGTLLFWAAVIVCGTAFFIACNSIPASQNLLREAQGEDEETAEELAEGGDSLRRLAFASLAGLGMVYLLLPTGRPARMDGLFPFLVIAFSLWCIATLAWSIAPHLSIRRLATAVCCFLAGLGLARQLSPRQLGQLALAVTTGFLVVGVLAEIALGTLRPWAANYQFCGTTHPNGQGLLCGLMALAALCLALDTTTPERFRSERRLYWALFVIALVFLFLTRSRTSTAASLVALSAVFVLHIPARVVIGVALAGIWLAGAVFFAAYLGGRGTAGGLEDIVLMGRSEHAESLSGRMPLWNKLLGDYFVHRPLWGYGFGAFWTPAHLHEFASALFWDIPDAHSIYMDTLINIGLVGAGLLTAGIFLGIRECYLLYRTTGDPGHRFLFALMVCALFEGFGESGFIMATFYTFIAGCGLLQRAFFSMTPVQGASKG